MKKPQRKITVSLKLTVEEMRLLQKQALIHAQGNVSMLLRMALITFSVSTCKNKKSPSA